MASIQHRESMQGGFRSTTLGWYHNGLLAGSRSGYHHTVEICQENVGSGISCLSLLDRLPFQLPVWVSTIARKGGEELLDILRELVIGIHLTYAGSEGMGV